VYCRPMPYATSRMQAVRVHGSQRLLPIVFLSCELTVFYDSPPGCKAGGFIERNPRFWETDRVGIWLGMEWKIPN